MQRIDKIKERLGRAIREQVFPGCVAGFINAGGEQVVIPAGSFTYAVSSPQVKDDTIYDTASITKSIPTGCIALKLIDEGKLDLQEKLTTYVPEFRNSDRHNVLMWHLLTYTLDGYGLASQNARNSEEVLKILLAHDFDKRPGQVFKYTNIPAALLGLAVERITRQPLDALAAKYFFTPLQMKRTTYYPEHFSINEIVPTEIDDWRGEVQGVVHDESAYICKRDGKVMGHAGIFSTVPDLLIFLYMLISRGVVGGQKYFSESIIKEMYSNQLVSLGKCTGLGWELNQPRYMGKNASEHTFGKTGFTGCIVLVDPAKEMGFAMLSNRIYPKRSSSSEAINAVRKDLADIVFA